MKYHIDTIPIWDAVKSGAPCALCALRRKTERMLIQRSLGASVMSPDTRKKVNQLGFCRAHQAMLFAQPGGNRLGHALMTLSYLQETRSRAQDLLLSSGKGTKTGAAGFFGRKAPSQDKTVEELVHISASCVLCEEMEHQSERQLESLLHLWKTDAAFREVFKQSPGLCLPDTAAALKRAPERLHGDALDSFVQTIKTALATHLQELEEDLAFFTQKFDYRNADKPWGNAKDALERSANALRGWCLGQEPLPEEGTR